MENSAPLSPEDAAVQSSLIKRKADKLVLADAGGNEQAGRAIEHAAKAAIDEYFGAADGQADYSRREAAAEDVSRMQDFACWCVFDSKAGPIIVALNAVTVLAAAIGGFGKPVGAVADGPVSGVDRFLASVFARRVASAIAPLVGDGEEVIVGNRLAVETEFSRIRHDQLNGRLDIIEFARFAIGDGVRLRFLIARPLSTVQASVRPFDPLDAGRQAEFSRRVARHALTAPVKLVARKKIARMSYAAAAALAPGDVLTCDAQDDLIELLAANNQSAYRLFDATIGQVDKTRAARLYAPQSRSDGNRRQMKFG